MRAIGAQGHIHNDYYDEINYMDGLEAFINNNNEMWLADIREGKFKVRSCYQPCVDGYDFFFPTGGR
jgi:hypothetical protein